VTIKCSCLNRDCPGSCGSSIVDAGQALVFQVDWGAGTPPTLTEATNLVADLVAKQRRENIPRIIAYLACQVIGYQRSQNADAKLAMSQIGTIVELYREQIARPAPEVGAS
jgi:hypothetical protein